ncbi:unnamed protein product [Brachionus calyciflorus]|uniref:TGF-beta family profile domain-containing protein n=1 Tax=Brachionus calyciflorus TaxID=104777 RepID=A0A813LXA2_9BILA|nr:unnamed protein product [Brachionus calyciflorus]
MKLTSLVLIVIDLISIINSFEQYFFDNQTELIDRSNPKLNSGCRKIDFHVNFHELGWDKWIIYPKVFNAHLCVGTCHLPKLAPQILRKRKDNRNYGGAGVIPRSLVKKLSNHAQVMSILEFKYPGLNRQMTKCVSTRLKPLTVISLDEMGRIKTKQYNDMIVEECGCK